MAEPEQSIIPKEKTRIFLLAILLTNIVAMLNTTTVTISLPTYMSVFRVDINTVQWVVIGYMLPLGMMMPLSGYLCERYSYRKVFLVGVTALGLCSVACACSANFYMLVLFRFLKGMAGGIIVPSTMSMLYRYIPKQLQSSYLGITVLFQSVGVAAGPTLAGLLLQAFSWHVLFLCNVPLILPVLWAGSRSIPAEKGVRGERVDLWGIVQISVGTGMVMVAFSEGEDWGWTSAPFWICLGMGIALVVLFIVRQFHTSHPLLNFAVLRYRPFVLTLLVQCTLSMTLGINGILSQFYFQTGRGFSPAETGLFLLGPSMVMLFGNMLTNALHKRGLRRSLITGGIALTFLGNLGLCGLTLTSNLLFVFFCFSLRFCGLAMVQMPLTDYGLGSVPSELSGHASSMFNWAKQVVQVVSTNILTVLLGLNLTRFYHAAGNTGIPVAGSDAYREAAVQAVNTDYIYLAVFLLISLACTFLIHPKKETA